MSTYAMSITQVEQQIDATLMLVIRILIVSL